jgi:hypothetical protein
MSETRLDANQLRELRALVQQMGYLPFGNKALRLLAELERIEGSANAAQLRERMEQAGYLPMSRALELIDRVMDGFQSQRSDFVLYPPTR